MSHHFDDQAGERRSEPTCVGLYLFDGAAGKTAMAMTCESGPGFAASDALHPEGFTFRSNLDDEMSRFNFSSGLASRAMGTETSIGIRAVFRCGGRRATEALGGDALGGRWCRWRNRVGCDAIECAGVCWDCSRRIAANQLDLAHS